MNAETSNDPIDLRRAQVAKWSGLAKRGGYLAIMLAMVVFVIGAATSFSPLVTSTIVTCLVVSALLLVPAVIFGYGVRAAEREELGLPPGH